MTPGDRTAILLLAAVSILSFIWAGASDRPYWALLSSFSLFWSTAALEKGWSTNPAAVLVCASCLALAPMLGWAAGAEEPLEVLLSPAVLFSLSLWMVSSTLPAEGCTVATMAFFTFLLAVSLGTLALLSLYYLDALFFTAFMPSNSSLMWPLTSLLVGTISISLVLRGAGWEEAAMKTREARG